MIILNNDSNKKPRYGKLFDELTVAQDGFDSKPTCFKILNEIELVYHVVIINYLNKKKC